ncbi:MAG: hypothetical protein IPM61_00945 [Chlorobi bacterium]|nr:MAG: hypothetical protein UZ07_CHB004001351 [Chlorobi bacterium OLB7]MBK8909874.1 hypothetical protein [Chlorobiota bacterium]MBX7215626.1 hypothetical protein [Candidatus Kapabacteria bacterium]MCE7934740.1 hypothetical protein [Chlorobi bacterium CHB2]
MELTIPFAVEGSPQKCVIELRDLSSRPIHRVFQGICQPGVHTIQFNLRTLPQPLDAGIYLLSVEIGQQQETRLVQYMP